MQYEEQSAKGGGNEPPNKTTLTLRRLPVWTTGLTILVASAAALMGRSLVELVPKLWSGTALASDLSESLIVMGFLVVLVGGVVGKRLLVRLQPLAPIVFHDDYVQLPRSAEAIRPRRLLYKDIMSVNEGGRPPMRHFFIESRHGVFHLPQAIFAEADGPEILFYELRQRILSLPQGGALLELTEQKRRVAAKAMTRRPFCTQGVLGVIAVFFLNTYLKGAFDTPLGLLRWGANAPVLVQNGEYFRLVAANFLHGGFMPSSSLSFLHVLMNGMAIYYLGTLLERLFGWARFLLVYLLSGVVAMTASAFLADAVMSVGASGAVFGLLGGFAVVSFRLRSQLPLGLRQPLRWWLLVLGLNALLPLLWPAVDVVAHVAGFVTGALVTALLLGQVRALPGPAGRPLTVLSAAVAGVCAIALGLAVRYAARDIPSEDDEMHFLELAVKSSRTSARSLNELAWDWAINPRTNAAQLQVAASAAHKAVEKDAARPEYEDTVATVLARQGKLPEAVEAARRAFTLAPDSALFATRLAHLLGALVKKSGPALGGYHGQIDVDEQRGDLVLLELSPSDRAAELYGILSRGDREVGLVRLTVGAKASLPLSYHPTTLPDALTAPAPKGEHWHVTLALADKPSGEPGDAQWTVTPIVPALDAGL